jgi:hypothetical protein
MLPSPRATLPWGGSFRPLRGIGCMRRASPVRGKIDEEKLKAVAGEDQLTEVHCFLGLSSLQKGKKEEAIGHFRWVKEHGDRSSTHLILAAGELDRLENERRSQNRH